LMHINNWFSLPAFDPDECDKIQQLCDQETVSIASVIDGKSVISRLSRNCKMAWLRRDGPNDWLYSRVERLFDDVNKRTLRFNIDGELETLQYLEYGFGNFYGTHTDNGADQVAERKLTMVIQLSDPSEYWGGRLRVYGQTKERHAPRERGHAAIFPSHLWHRANPVWRGKRKVLVAWKRGTKPLS